MARCPRRSVRHVRHEPRETRDGRRWCIWLAVNADGLTYEEAEERRKARDAEIKADRTRSREQKRRSA